ncbi:MAG: serpin family protein [Firmicutes bacterium]|nr:serpin family protein [Bacillota bacterium]
MRKIMCVGLMLIVVCGSFLGCTKYEPYKIQATDLMKHIQAAPVTGAEADNTFISAVADFSFDLFKEALDTEDSTLVSPLSVLLALAMTANGAEGQTRQQFEAVLGGGMAMQELNEYLYSFVKSLTSQNKSVLEIANSIWFKEGEINVLEEFLQTNADYYGAAAYGGAFDESTVDDINAWVKAQTKGLIDKILEQIPADAVMYLINTVYFDAEWLRPYTDSHPRVFTANSGAKQTAPFMSSDETLYLTDAHARGFIKPYVNNHYSFAALLPNEGISVHDYINSLSGGKFVTILNNAQNALVATSMPKFEYEFELSLVDALQALGITEAFNPFNADFSRIGTTDYYENLFISDVLHKTFITVDLKGTKAAAVTSVAVNGAESAPEYIDYIVLERPFIYAIVDNATNLPLFIGAVLNV